MIHNYFSEPPLNTKEKEGLNKLIGDLLPNDKFKYTMVGDDLTIIPKQ